MRGREEDEGELISSTHAHRAALRIPRDSPGIPHNIPFSPLTPAAPLKRVLPNPTGRPPCPPHSLRLVAAVPTGSTGLSNFPKGSQDQDRFRCDYFSLIILHCISCYCKSKTRLGQKCIDLIYFFTAFFSISFIFHVFSVQSKPCTVPKINYIQQYSITK